MMSSVKKATLCSMCIALCCVLPLAFHAAGLGSAFSPMHIPILLCGLLCGWSYGAFCGIAGPVLSCLISSMPAAAQLSYMIPELAVYGLVSGLLFSHLRTGRLLLDLYLSLIPAMLLGRIVGGIARMIVCLGLGQPYSLSLWASAYFAASLPGILIHLILIPTLCLVLSRTGVWPVRREKTSPKEGA